MLTSAQLTTLKNDIAANTNTINMGGVIGTVQIKNLANNPDANAAIALWYSGAASPDYLVWRTEVPRVALRATVTLANYTPSDAVPGSPSTDLTYSNRAFLAQLKQANALFLISGDGTVDASNVNFRASCRDCMRQIPTGTSGADQDAGWGAPASPGAVRLAMMRSASNVEKLFGTAGSGAGNTGTDPRGSNTNPDVMAYEGAISGPDVAQARAS